METHILFTLEHRRQTKSEILILMAATHVVEEGNSGGIKSLDYLLILLINVIRETAQGFKTFQ